MIDILPITLKPLEKQLLWANGVSRDILPNILNMNLAHMITTGQPRERVVQIFFNKISAIVSNVSIASGSMKY